MSKDHPTHDYPRAVVDGKVVVGRYVRQLCERHLTDLVHGKERGLWFDHADADLALNFFRLLRFTKGKWAGKEFTLSPWQTFLIGSAFGWKREDGLRRFREVHLEVARKNGKTETAAGCALKLTAADRESGSEVYCLATKRDQAKLTFDVAKQMIGKSPSLRKHLRRLTFRVHHDATGSKLEPLGADADSLDGLNVHGSIKDELHAWKSRDLWDVIDTATGARDQPLGITTTTAGFNRNSIWWERRELGVKLLEGRADFQNDELLPLIYTLDEEDDWTDPEVWIKGNPNLGVTIRKEELAARCNEAKQNPGLANSFRRLRLDQPTESVTKWLPLGALAAAWDDMPESALEGRVCFGGLDLSQTLDLTAWALIFPPAADDPCWRLLVRHFLPGHELRDRMDRDGFNYEAVADGTRLTLTEGNWVDYETVERRILQDAERFRLVSLAYDRRFAPPLIQKLIKEGLECVPWSQTFGGLNTGTKEFKSLLTARLLRFPKCPLFEWETDNTVIEIDSAGNERPHKGKSTRRIDGVVAAINALSLAGFKFGSEQPDAGVETVEVDKLFEGTW